MVHLLFSEWLKVIFTFVLKQDILEEKLGWFSWDKNNFQKWKPPISSVLKFLVKPTSNTANEWSAKSMFRLEGSLCYGAMVFSHRRRVVGGTRGPMTSPCHASTTTCSAINISPALLSARNNEGIHDTATSTGEKREVAHFPTNTGTQLSSTAH